MIHPRFCTKQKKYQLSLEEFQEFLAEVEKSKDFPSEQAVEKARDCLSVCHYYMGNYETVINYDGNQQLNFCVVVSLMKVGKHQEAYDMLSKGKWDEHVQTLALKILSAKFLGLPFQELLQKLFEKCKMSMAELQSILEINPPEYVQVILDLLIEESGRNQKYLIFRNSYLFSQSLLRKYVQ